MIYSTKKSYRSEILDSIRKMGTENLDSAFDYFISGFGKNFLKEFEKRKSQDINSLKIFLKCKERTFYLDKATLSGTFKEFRDDLEEFKRLPNLGLFNFKFSQADIELAISLNREEFRKFLKEKFKKKVEECYLFFLNDFNSLIKEEAVSVADLIKSRSCFPLLDADNIKSLLNNNRAFSCLIYRINSKESQYLISCFKKILVDKKLTINSNIRSETLKSFKNFCLDKFESYYYDFIKNWDSSLLVNEDLLGVLQYKKRINSSDFNENQELYELILKLYDNKPNFNDSIEIIKSIKDLNLNNEKINNVPLFIIDLYFDKINNELTTEKTSIEKSKQVSNTALYNFKLSFKTEKDLNNAKIQLKKHLRSYDYNYDPKELYYFISDLDELLYNLLPIEILNLVTIQMDLFCDTNKRSLIFSRVESSTDNIKLENCFIDKVVLDIEFIKKLLTFSDDEIDYQVKEKIRSVVVNKYNNLRKDF